ncbi:MAG: hypothetical protein N2259_02480 [Patescibacteria group bacterium]|nr:hypothetical protein [Patescibacteria group bacterium]
MPQDKIILKLLEHDERLERIEEKMATKDDMREIMEMLEGITTIAQRLDQERIFTAEWVKRIEKEVEEHRQEIIKIKKVLKIT